MKKLLFLFLVLTIAVTLSRAILAQIPDSNQDTKTQVVIIGTIHSGHHKNPNYSPERLKEIILSLKPDAILNELPLSQVEADGRPLERLRGKECECPESWATDTVAQQLGIRQIPFDRPDREENYRKTNYFEREKRNIESANKWHEEVQKNKPNAVDLKIALLLWKDISPTLVYLGDNSSPEVINSEAYDNLVEAKQSIRHEILPEILTGYNGYETSVSDYRFEGDQWLERNKIMADNIVKAAKECPGKRLVVITGSYHRYILRDLLKDIESIDLKEYWEITLPDINKSHELKGQGQAGCLDSIVESNVILHITPRKDWNKALASGEYCPESLNTGGYIHCSKPSQIIKVANHLFKGQKELVLLVIDAKKVKSEIKWEGKEQANLYPHIYGTLNLDAVQSVLDFPPSDDGTFELPEQSQKDKNMEIKQYYANHGDITNPGKHVEMYEGLPADVNQLCKIVQGSLIHLFHAHRYGVTLTDEQKKDVQLRRVEDMLEQIRKSDERPIQFAREPDKRLVGNCRHFAVLLCSMLRHKNIPARARCGFATYFPSGEMREDHWICEYWNEKQARWIQVDAQLDSVQLEQMHIDINPMDLPKGAFLPAGTVWQLCKAGKENPNRFGFSDMKGMWFISGNVVRDFMVLNKVELLPWDNMDLMIGPEEKSTLQKDAMIDRLAEMSNLPDDNFEQVRSLYEHDNQFQMQEHK